MPRALRRARRSNFRRHRRRQLGGRPGGRPTTGLVYVSAQDTSLVGWVERREGDKPYSFDYNSSDQPYDRASVDGKGPFFSFSAPLSDQYDANGRPQGPQAPCYKPPWGELVAVDANTGAIKWSVPLGVMDELPEGKRLVGNSGSAGPTVTAGGLVFVGATNDRRFRAFDAQPDSSCGDQLRANANANHDLSPQRQTSSSMPVALSLRIRYPARIPTRR